MDNNGRIIVQLIDCNNKLMFGNVSFPFRSNCKDYMAQQTTEEENQPGRWNQSWAGGRAGSSPPYRNCCEMPGRCVGRQDLCT